jgi:hypothetical protein
MPEAARALERAANEGWSTSEVSEVLKVAPDEVPELAAAFDRARQIIDAENPAELFRNAVRFSIRDAVSEVFYSRLCEFRGLFGRREIEVQKCYHRSDICTFLQLVPA